MEIVKNSNIFVYFVAFFTLVFVLLKAHLYQMARISRNSLVVNSINKHTAQRYILKNNYEFTYFCREVGIKKKLIIMAGAVFFLSGKDCLFCFKDSLQMPDKIKLKYGTTFYNSFIFRIPKWLYEETNLEHSASEYKIIDQPLRQQEKVCF